MAEASSPSVALRISEPQDSLSQEHHLGRETAVRHSHTFIVKKVNDLAMLSMYKDKYIGNDENQVPV